MDSKLFHWDIAIRLLSSKSLSVLVPLETDLAKAVVIPTLLQKSISSDLIVRHGAVVGLAETVLALTNTEWKENDETLRVEIAELVPKIEKLRLYRGRGGEIMRSAVCRLVECISQSKLALTVKQQVKRTLSSPSRTNVLTPLFLLHQIGTAARHNRCQPATSQRRHSARCEGCPVCLDAILLSSW